MTATRFLTVALACSVATLPSAGCSRNGKKSAPAAEVQTQTPMEQLNAPITVTGCLRAGDAPDTFVLTVARSTEGEQTATYQLRGGQADQLRDQVGKRLEVSGILSAQQRVGSLSTSNAVPKAKGTAGTPTVSTETEVNVRHLEVQSVRPLGDRCEVR